MQCHCWDFSREEFMVKKSLKGWEWKGHGLSFYKACALTPQRRTVSCDSSLQGSKGPTFCLAPYLWPPMTSVIPSEGWAPPPAETGTEPAVWSACKCLLKPPSMSSSVLRLPQHSCGQLRSASDPAMDYVPDDSCPLKILETTRNTLYGWEIRSTKRDQRKAMTFEEQANISAASFPWDRYIMRKCILWIPRHPFVFWFPFFFFFSFCFFLVGGTLGEEFSHTLSNTFSFLLGQRP